MLIIPLRWTLQGLPETLEKPAQRVQALNPHCTPAWLWDQLAWSTFAAIHSSTCQTCKYRLIPGQSPSSGHAGPHESECALGGWFLTAPGRVGLVTGCPWGYIWRGGRTRNASCPSRDKTLSYIVTTRELLFSTVNFVGNLLLYTSPGIWSAF